MNKTTLLKQQLEGQINVLKEQINTVRMNDEHYDNRQQSIRIEIETREAQYRELKKEQDAVQIKLLKSEKDEKAKQALIEVQSRIAGHTANIEQSKQEIMNLLNSRASTGAKIQHYDTTQEQITTRKAELNKLLLEMSGSGERLTEELKKQEAGLAKVKEEIAEYESRIRENERKIGQSRREFPKDRKNFGSDRQPTIESLPVWNR